MVTFTLAELEANAYRSGDIEKADIIAQLSDAKAQLSALYEKTEELISHIKEKAEEAERTFYYADGIALVSIASNEFLALELALDRVNTDFLE